MVAAHLPPMFHERSGKIEGMLAIKQSFPLSGEPRGRRRPETETAEIGSLPAISV